MITTLTVSNYRSLGEDVRIDFGKLTVLVGPNDAGKSNVLDAIRFVAEAVDAGLSGAVAARGGFEAVRRRSADPGRPVVLRVDMSLPSGPAHYAFALSSPRPGAYEVDHEEAEVGHGGARVRFRVEHGSFREGPEGIQPMTERGRLALPIVGGDARFHDLAQALHGIAVYTLFADALRAPQRPTPARPMSRDGANWISVLGDAIEQGQKPDLVAGLHKLTGSVSDVRVTPVSGYLVAQFAHAGPGEATRWVDAGQESDGLLHVAALCTALLQEPRPLVIGIEEPEVNVHPGSIPLLFGYVAQATRQSQVILTTHSPEVLDLVRPEDVRVVARDGTGETLVARLLGPQGSIVTKRLMTLGELMRTEGLLPDLPAAAE